MNITEVYKSVKRRSGLFDLPLPSKITEQDLIDIIIEESLPTFSIYLPHVINVPYNPFNFKVPGRNKYFFIDPLQLNLGSMISIVSIEDIEYSDNLNSGFISSLDVYRGMSYLDYAYALMDATSANVGHIPVTWEYEPPDKLYIEDNHNGIPMEVVLKLGIVHPNNLSTIDLTYRENFIKLATYDIQWFLYENVFKRHDGINTTFENISLKIDNFADAESKREDLINKWQDKYINNKKRKIFIT